MEIIVEQIRVFDQKLLFYFFFFPVKNRITRVIENNSGRVEKVRNDSPIQSNKNVTKVLINSKSVAPRTFYVRHARVCGAFTHFLRV